jgi:hypothetical protein
MPIANAVIQAGTFHSENPAVGIVSVTDAGAVGGTHVPLTYVGGTLNLIPRGGNVTVLGAPLLVTSPNGLVHGAVTSANGDGVYVGASSDHMTYVRAGANHFLRFDPFTTSSLAPTTGSTYHLGLSSLRWATVYATSANTTLGATLGSLKVGRDVVEAGAVYAAPGAGGWGLTLIGAAGASAQWALFNAAASAPTLYLTPDGTIVRLMEGGGGVTVGLDPATAVGGAAGAGLRVGPDTTLGGTDAAPSATATPNGALRVGWFGNVTLSMGAHGTGGYVWMQARHTALTPAAQVYPLYLNPLGGGIVVGTNRLTVDHVEVADHGSATVYFHGIGARRLIARAMDSGGAGHRMLAILN